MMRREKIVILVAVVAIAFLPGCAEQGEPTGDLHGKVYSNGEVIGDCLIYLYSKSSKRTIGTTVNGQGEFEFTDIALGECKLAVSQKTSSDPNGPPFDSRIPVKFRTTGTSGFETDIKEGDNQIELKMVF